MNASNAQEKTITRNLEHTHDQLLRISNLTDELQYIIDRIAIRPPNEEPIHSKETTKEPPEAKMVAYSIFCLYRSASSSSSISGEDIAKTDDSETLSGKLRLLDDYTETCAINLSKAVSRLDKLL
jgi:hypothetical protein